MNQSSSSIFNLIDTIRRAINQQFQDTEPLKLILLTGGTVYLATSIYSFMYDSPESAFSRSKKFFFYYLKKIPSIRQKIDEEMEKARKSMEEEFLSPKPGEKFNYSLPAKRNSAKQVIEYLNFLKNLGHVNINKGRISGTVYYSDINSDEYNKLLVDAYALFAWSNPLHPDVFPGVRKMEAEVVSMVAKMFHGDSQTCGTMTSGGTESIMMAIRAYRQRGYERGINRPELIVPVTAHSAFDKACDYFRIKIIHIDVDPETRRVNVAAVKRAISRNTIAIVGSCPSFPHGIIDNIPELAILAKKYKIGLHVDSCLGGFLTPFMEKAGYKLPFLCDFRVDGVTSISVDTHKYGFSPKGSSVVLYKDKKLRSYQYFTSPDWPGGIYASPSMAGSRPGALIAATWTALMYHGEEGYIESTRKIISTARHIEEELRQIKGIFVFGKPDTSVIGIGSKEFDIYRLSGAMTKRGWNLNTLQFPSSIHLCVTLVHTKESIADEFIRDVKEIVSDIIKNPQEKATGSAALYGMAQGIPDRSVISTVGETYLDVVYEVGGKPSQ